ncbi:tail fiber domain-containing protein [Aureitalea marina]|uniref:Peptidase S74 domain-containing protein n=1 Tax=Aureitalea marina TaxID=930804 RepID=A0A2S7KN98_9FLAO|nr:tail fiber domain-containing protein [Aureitalea marina]PQB04109.1 hypothetical protein BST85_03730 [Aureitalea marina]
MFVSSIGAFAQVGINTTTPADGAMLDIESTSKGLLIPRVALTSTAVSAPVTPEPVTGVLVFNTATDGTAPNDVVPGFYWWDGTEWVTLEAAAEVSPDDLDEKWDLEGNAGTDQDVNFVGTTDNTGLTMRTNNTERFRVTTQGGGQVIGMQDGTPGNPFYSFNSDPSAGLWTNAVGELDFSINSYRYININGNATGSQRGEVTLNPGSFDIDFIVQTANTNAAMVVNGENDNVGLGTTAPDASSQLQLADPDKGLLINKVVLSATDNASPITSPATGLMVYNLVSAGSGATAVSPGFYSWDGSAWVPFVRSIDDLSDARSDVDGSNNGSSVFFGIDSGASDDGTNNKNVGIGYQSLVSGAGENNTAIGYQSAGSTAGGSGNTAIGKGALTSNTSGNNNTAIGLNALSSSTTSGGNIAIGKDAMSSSNGATANVAIGTNALQVSTTDGNTNIAMGSNSMLANTTGSQNVALGVSTLRENLTGGNNMALGVYSLRWSTEGEGHTAVGPYALNKYVGPSTDKGNTAIGNLTINALTTGGGNVGIGFESFRFGLQGDDNTMIGKFTGFHAGRDGTKIDENVFIGASAGFASTGSRNVYIGASAGSYSVGGPPPTTYSTGSDNVFIGNSVGKNSTAGAMSNTLLIDNSSTTQSLIYGDFSNDEVGINWDYSTTPSLPNTLSVNGDASKTTSGNWLANSDRRLKKDINTIKPNEALDMITQLRGVTYHWNDNQTGLDRPETIQYGFVAQELMEVFPEKVTKDGLGFYQTAYGDYDALFVQAFKELKAQNEEKDERIAELEDKLQQMEALADRLSALETKLGVGETDSAKNED